jgi:hypothetical protein
MRWFWSMTVNGPMTRADRVATLEVAKAGVKKCWDEWKRSRRTSSGLASRHRPRTPAPARTKASAASRGSPNVPQPRRKSFGRALSASGIAIGAVLTAGVAHNSTFL